MTNFAKTTSRLKTFHSSSIARAWRKTWSDYCDASYMHGMKYIYDKEASIYIRALWAVTMLAMFISANHMAFTIWADYISDPSKIVIESDHARTAHLLYPSVTVCPATVFNYTKAKQSIAVMSLPENVTADDVLRSLDQTYAFMDWSFVYSKEKISILEKVMKLNNFTANEFLYNNRWNFNDFFLRCRFHSKLVSCSELFHPSRTSVGFCATFNGHQKAEPSKRFKANRHTLRHGLSFILKDVELDLEHTYSRSQRFEVLINEAHVYPDEFNFRKVLHRNEELLLRAQPTAISCSREVWRRLTIEERKCALSSEIKMHFFPEYNKENCLIECRSFIVQEACGCVPFYLFRDKNTSACDFEHIPCIADNYERIQAAKENCNCVESCEKVDFSISSTRRNIDSSIEVVDPLYDDMEVNFTVVHVYLQSQLYRQIRRDIVWNMVAKVANIGNCYSVFTGLSSLAVYQFVYFFTFVLKRNYASMIEMDQRILFKKKYAIPKVNQM